MGDPAVGRRAARALPFPPAEYSRRLQDVQSEMRSRGLDLLLLSSAEDIYYVSGYGTKAVFAFQLAVVSLDGPVALITRSIEQGNVEAAGSSPNIGVVETYSDREPATDAFGRLCSRLRLRPRRVGVQKASWWLTLSRYEPILRALPSVQDVVDASDIVEGVRLVKSPTEVAYLREAARICDGSLDAGERAVQEGATEDDVARAAVDAMIRLGGEWVATWPNVQAGWRTGLAHAPWGGEVIRSGEPILMEIAGVVHRYHAPGYRTVFVGNPATEVRRLADAIRWAHEAGVAAMAPEVSLGEVDRAQRAVMEAAGFGRLLGHRTGYAVGIGFPPTWGPNSWTDAVPDSPLRLRPGMAFHLVLYAFKPAVLGIALGQTVLVTERGHEILTNRRSAGISYLNPRSGGDADVSSGRGNR